MVQFFLISLDTNLNLLVYIEKPSILLAFGRQHSEVLL